MRAGSVVFAICAVFSTSQAQDSTAVMNLPIEIVPADGKNDVLVLYLTGDGGWNKFSQDLGHSFTKRGYSLVALNSRKYFWDAKTPETFSRDINSIAIHFLRRWKKSTVLIVGYSFGADVAAFLPGRLPPPLRSKTKLLVLLSAAASTDFVVRFSDLLGSSDSRDHKYKVAAELEKSPLPILCIFGSEENLILKKELRPGAMIKIEELPGSHRYNEASGALVDRILSKL